MKENNNRPDEFREREWNPLRVSFYRLLVGLILIGLFGGMIRLSTMALYEYSSTIYYSEELVLIYFSILPIALMHCLGLVLVRRLTTHTVRDWIGRILLLFAVPALLISLISIIAGLPAILSHPDSLFMYISPTLLLLTLIMMVFCFMHSFQAYSMPSSWLSILPLAMIYMVLIVIPLPFIFHKEFTPPSHHHHYIWSVVRCSGIPLMIYFFFFTNLYAALAGFWFPVHRRLKYYWKPTPLPRLSSKHRGMTLIELLITIAIISIMAAPIVHLSAVAHRTIHSQQTWNKAIALAQDEIAMLRTEDRLPAPGAHPIHPEVAELHPQLSDSAEVEIKPGPNEKIRQVQVTVHINNEFDRRDVTLAVLLPAEAWEVGSGKWEVRSGK